MSEAILGIDISKKELVVALLKDDKNFHSTPHFL